MVTNAVHFITGAGLGGGLIIAIGAQNAYLLGQAIRSNHALLIAALCSVIDVTLIAVGIAGMGAIIENSPAILWVITVGGSLFLFTYGYLAFRRALYPAALHAGRGEKKVGVREVVITTLALSLLNPHVYLDTVLLLGGMGARLADPGPMWFGAGAAMASFVWFFSLALAGRGLARWLREPHHWQKLDILIGLVMWIIAMNLSMSLPS